MSTIWWNSGSHEYDMRDKGIKKVKCWCENEGQFAAEIIRIKSWRWKRWQLYADCAIIPMELSMANLDVLIVPLRIQNHWCETTATQSREVSLQGCFFDAWRERRYWFLGMKKLDDWKKKDMGIGKGLSRVLGAAERVRKCRRSDICQADGMTVCQSALRCQR